MVKSVRQIRDGTRLRPVPLEEIRPFIDTPLIEKQQRRVIWRRFNIEANILNGFAAKWSAEMPQKDEQRRPFRRELLTEGAGLQVNPSDRLVQNFRIDLLQFHYQIHHALFSSGS